METENRLAAFQRSVDERFLPFLTERGYSVVERTSITDRYGAVRFKSAKSEVNISWDTYDGDIEASVNGCDLWKMLAASGDWARNGYQGFAVEAMERGLDRLAQFLYSHPETL
jgi:hypothetical protein